MAARARSAGSLDADPDSSSEIADPSAPNPEADLAARESRVGGRATGSGSSRRPI